MSAINVEYSEKMGIQNRLWRIHSISTFAKENFWEQIPFSFISGKATYSEDVRLQIKQFM